MNNEYYIERQKKWIDEVGLKVGDKVMLVGDPDPWRISRTMIPHSYAMFPRGEPMVVREIRGDYICADTPTAKGYKSGNFFPFYVLLKINE